MSNDRKYQEIIKKDHIVTIETSEDSVVVESDRMTSEDAHELFSWLGQFPTLRVTIVQTVPVVTRYDYRVLWIQEPGGGPTTHVNDSLKEVVVEA